MRIEFVDTEGASRIHHGVAVVIDVMRAYTVAAWALHRGAKELVLMDDIDEAIALADASPESLLFKDGLPDPRFDLHNSPHQLLALDVRDRTIIQRTTAGTRAAVAARYADSIYCASFVCATATAQSIRRLSPATVTFVISGGFGAGEDIACAEFIAETLNGQQPHAADYIDRALESDAASDLRHGVQRGFTGVAAEDVSMCANADRFGFAMMAIDRSGHLVLRKTGEIDT